MIDIVGMLSQVPSVGAYALIALLVLAESILLIGAFVPTFTVLVTAGAMGSAGLVNPVVVVIIAAAAVVIGDFLGHRTGHTIGGQPRVQKLMGRIPDAVRRRAENAIAQHGGRAVFFGRFIPVVRTVTPHLTAVVGVPYVGIALYSAAAAFVWATAEVTLGYLAAASLPYLISYGALAVATIVAATGARLLGSKQVYRRTVYVRGTS